MKKLVFTIFLIASLVECIKKESNQAYLEANKQTQLIDLSQEIFQKINELRDEHGKIASLHWDSVIYSIAEKCLNQILLNSEQFGSHQIFEDNFKEQHFIESFGEVMTQINSISLNPGAIVNSWRYTKVSLETILKNYEIGAVCVKTVKGKSYAVGVFAKIMLGNRGKQGEQGDRGIQGIHGGKGEVGDNYNCSETEIELNENLINQLKLKLQQQNYKTLPNGQYASTCKEYQDQLGSSYEDGIYMLKVNGRRMKAYCEDGWIVFLRRTHDTNFYQDWQGYAQGFGELDDDFWLGLQNLHELTKQNRTLQIDLWHYNQQASSIYSGFQIGTGQGGYKMMYDKFEGGEAGNSFEYHKDQKFSTYDKDNDKHDANCAAYYECGWWFNGCHQINLNGRFSNTTEFGMGINCNSWLGQETSLTKAIMKIQ